jgi:predicted cation transporter
MIYVLILLLLLTFVLPIISKKVEENLEFFLFLVGLSACIAAGALNKELFLAIVQNKFMYIITFAVFLGGMLFKVLAVRIKEVLTNILKHISIRFFIFLLIVILGLLSSVITAIIASLLLVEIVSFLPINRKNKIFINIIACFSIGLGAVLTPIGEPLATVIVSKLNVDFWFLLNQFGIYIIPGIIILGFIGSVYAKKENFQAQSIQEVAIEAHVRMEEIDIESIQEIVTQETNRTIVIRALKIFLFIIALDLLGEGFKPIIDTYVIALDTRYLYWVNMCSAVLDNATLAAAEISIKMSRLQVEAVLMGLLISGGMMIPGNIPNIISAGKLKIKSREWIKIGVPLGLTIMVIYYFVLFVI